MNSNDHDDPIVRLSLGEFRGADGFEAWHQLTAPLWRTDPLGNPDRFKAGGQMFGIGSVVFSDVCFGAQRFEHIPRIHQHDDLLLLELYHQGQARGLLGDQVTMVGPERLQMVDFSRPYRTVTTDVRTWGLCIPYSDVGYDPARHPAYLSWQTESPEATTLIFALRNLWHALADENLQSAKQALSDVLNLVRYRLAVRSDELDRRKIETIKGRCIERYIEDHLEDFALDTDRLCRIFYCSRATLYRHFKDIGGIERYIRDRRLERCLIELGNSRPERGEVRRVAARWGFDNPSYFNRLFVAQFGVRPGDWLGYPVSRRDLSYCSGDSADVSLDHLFGQAFAS